MQGYDVEIASDAVWSSKTTAQFSTYQAIVFGDGRFTDATAQGMTPPWSLFEIHPAHDCRPRCARRHTSTCFSPYLHHPRVHCVMQATLWA